MRTNRIPRSLSCTRFRALSLPLAGICFLGSLLSGGLLSDLQAQLPQTRLYSIFPPGAQQGTTVDLQITSGEDLDEANRLLFSHPGIHAAQKTNVVNGQPQPVTNQFTVTVDSNVPPGRYDVRVVGRFGVSNPRTFVVGDRKEIAETEPNNTPEQATPVEINTLVNGRSNSATDVDYYKFTAKQGQRILVSCVASRLDSKMDAVLELYGPTGKPLAYNRNQIRRDPLLDFTIPADGEYMVKVYDFLYAGDPNQYPYRLSVHTGPHIDFVLPPSGLPNTTGEFTLYGRNLPGGTPTDIRLNGQPLEQRKVSIPLPADPAQLQPGENLTSVESGVSGISYSLPSPVGASNPVTIYFASAPVILETEPNDEPQKAHKVSVPCEYVGQFQARGDMDYLTFEAKAKDIYWIEVYGQRNGTNADPYFILERVVVNDKGEEQVSRITAQDDITVNLNTNNTMSFDTRSDDAAYRFVVPADGTYRVCVRDRYFESRGAPNLVYRLSIRQEQPDFRLVSVASYPSAQANAALPGDINLRRGDNLSVDVLAHRLDGFDGVIDISVEGLPPGVTASPASIGPGDTAATLVFTSTEQAQPWTGAIRIIGKARIEDPAKVREVEAAKAAIAEAEKALPPLLKAATDAETAAKAAAEAAEKAKAAAAAKADDQGLAKARDDAEKAAQTAQESARKAAEAKAAGEKRIADARAAADAAEKARDAAARDVAREARGGTVVWNMPNNIPAVSRVTRNITLAVLDEVAPFQALTDVGRVEVNQSSQILVPVKLLKRNGFDENVNLTFAGQPQRSQLQIENKPIPKGKDSEVLRIFAPNNAPPGTYTIYLKSQAQVSYSRNPEAAEAAKKDQEAAAKAATEAAELAKKTAAEKAEAEKTATAAAAEAKKAADAKTAADKAAAESAAAAKKAADEAAAAKAAAEKEPENKGLADALAAAEKKAAEAAEAQKKADEAKAAAEKAAADAAAAVKAAEEAKAKATAAAADADAKSKAAAAAKTAADKKATDTANAAKPKNVQFFPPSTALVVTVKPGPATLAANVPAGGAIKRGAKLEVKVTVNRINGFAGPVTLSLRLPPGVEGLTAAPVTIPADAKEGTLVIEAAGNATQGKLPNMVIRGSMEFQGQAAVDVPVTLSVN